MRAALPFYGGLVVCALSRVGSVWPSILVLGVPYSDYDRRVCQYVKPLVSGLLRMEWFKSVAEGCETDTQVYLLTDESFFSYSLHVSKQLRSSLLLPLPPDLRLCHEWHSLRMSVSSLPLLPSPSFPSADTSSSYLAPF